MGHFTIRDSLQATSNKMIIKTTDLKDLLIKNSEWKLKSNWNCYTIANINLLQITRSDLYVRYLWSKIIWYYRFYDNFNICGCESETIFQCFVYHSISVFGLGLLQIRTLTGDDAQSEIHQVQMNFCFFYHFQKYVTVKNIVQKTRYF